MYREAGEKLSEFFLSIGINPLYAATIGCLILSATYIKDLKNWEDQEWWSKSFIILTFLSTAMLLFFSLLLLLGILKE